MKKNEKFSRPSRRCVTSFHARFREYFYIFLSCLLFCFDRRFHLRVWLLFYFLHISLFCVLRARISTPRFVLFVCLFVFFVGTDCWRFRSQSFDFYDARGGFLSGFYIVVFMSVCYYFNIGFRLCWRWQAMVELFPWDFLVSSDCYRVFTSFFLQFCRVGNGSNPVFPGSTRTLSSFGRFYWVLLGFTGFYWVLLGFTRF